MSYIAVPAEISSETVKSSGYSFSPSQYKSIVLPNKNFLFVRDFMSRKLEHFDLGTEVGSVNYIDKSPYYFLRTKGLQKHSFIPDINTESLIPVNPKAFNNQELSEGDLIISKDSNIGEIIILDRDYPNWMLSGALYKLPVNKWKYYLLGFIKHEFFREQLDYMVPKSATIRHAKTMFLDCKIPLPNKNTDEVIEYVELMVQAIINKEKVIRKKHQLIYDTIHFELTTNQNVNKFEYKYPSLAEVKAAGRLDTNLFSRNFKERDFLIRNYKYGVSSIEDLQFDISRGQNLQISNIGESIYSDTHFEGFYTLVLPKHLSKYGTVLETEYLGNRKQLKTLKKGDLIFGAEGFEKGRSLVILEERSKAITNIHGITLHQQDGNIQLSLFVKCFLDYLRTSGLIDLFAVGGNGGSLAMKYWNVIPFPNFPEAKQSEIAKYYYNPDALIKYAGLTLENFLQNDNILNRNGGINEIDESVKKLKSRLKEVLDLIVKDEKVETSFGFMDHK